MHTFITLKCYNCSSVVLNLPDSEVKKLEGMTFMCECCGHQNTILGEAFIKCDLSEPKLNIFNFEPSFG